MRYNVIHKEAAFHFLHHIKHFIEKPPISPKLETLPRSSSFNHMTPGFQLNMCRRRERETSLSCQALGYSCLQTFISICLSVCPSVRPSVHPSIHIYIYLSLSIYLYLSLSISIYLYLSLSISISIYIYLYLYLSISIHIYPYLSISIHIYPYLSISIYIYIYLYHRHRSMYR